MAYATPEDVEARLGRPLEEWERTVVAQRLEDAELILRSRIPDLDERIADGRVSEDAVVMVESEMVMRLVRNPEIGRASCRERVLSSGVAGSWQKSSHTGERGDSS